MQNWFLLFCACIICFSASVKSDDSCIYKSKDLKFFDYTGIHKNTGDLEIKYQSKSGSIFNIDLNLCRDVVDACQDVPSMATIYPIDSLDVAQECSNLQTFEVVEKLVPFEAEIGEKDHLILELSSNEPCPYYSDGTKRAVLSETELMSLEVEIKCIVSKSVDQQDIIKTNSKESGSNVCHPKIIIESDHGCQISRIEAFTIFFDTYYWAFALIFITFGLYNLTYGGKMFKLTISLFGIFSTVALVFFVLVIILELHNMSQMAIWITLGLSISIGAIIGYFMTRIVRVGVCVIGCWTGLIGALLMDSFIFAKIGIPYMLYILMVILLPLCGYLAYKYYEYVLIFSSSILGAYFLVRGVSLFCGGYPNEVDLFHYSSYSSIPWTFYIYMLSMVLLSIVGVVFQVKRLSKTPAKKKKTKRVLRIKKNKTSEGNEAPPPGASYQDMEEEIE